MKRSQIRIFIIPIVLILMLTLACQKKDLLKPQENEINPIVDSAFKQTDCKKVTGPKYGNKYYNGPLIDTHYHIPAPAESLSDKASRKDTEPVLGQNLTISDINCTLKQENTKKVFAFFPIYRGMTDNHLAIVKQALRAYPNRFVPFIMPPDDDGSPQGSPTVDVNTLKDMLSVYPGLFKGYGEIGLYARNGGAAALPPNSTRLKEIYPLIRKNKLSVYFHLGENQQKSFEKTLDQNPDINFIFHGDQLIPTSGDEQDLKYLEQIISRHKNVYYTIDEFYGNQWMIRPDKSKKQFLDYLKNYKDLLKYDISVWKGIIERNPDQFMWGTDRSPEVLWSHDAEVGQALANYGRAFIAKLDPKVQEKFAYKNAESLLAE